MYHLFSVFFPPLALIALGFYLKTRGILELKFWDGAEKLNYYILFPSLLFLSLSQADTHIFEMHDLLAFIFIIMIMVIIATYVCAAIYKTPISRIGVYIQSLIRFNTYLGLSIALTISNDQVKSILVSILAIAIPFVNVVSILALTPKDQLQIKRIFYALIKNPLISSCILGILFNYCSIPIWTGIENLLNTFSQSSLMLGLLCVGAAIHLQELKDYLNQSVLISGLRLVVLPVCVFLATFLVDFNQAEVMAIMIFFSIPTASSAYILTKILKGEYRLMAGIISLQTILSVISLPLMIYLITVYF